MNKDERPTMASIESVVKYLVEIWRESKCVYTYECKNCKYNELCPKLYELAKVVDK